MKESALINWRPDWKWWAASQLHDDLQEERNVPRLSIGNDHEENLKYYSFYPVRASFLVPLSEMG
jgi:hypothetical protein